VIKINLLNTIRFINLKSQLINHYMIHYKLAIIRHQSSMGIRHIAMQHPLLLNRLLEFQDSIQLFIIHTTTKNDLLT